MSWASPFKHGLGSDFTITCRGQEFKLRKSILAVQSPFFKDLFDNNKKTKVNELGEAILDLSDDDPTAVDALVQYVCFGNYTKIEQRVVPELEGTQQTPTAVRRLHLHAHVFILGDKYDVPGLRTLALKHFSEMIKHFPKHIESNLFRHSVRLVYRGTTPEKGKELRSLLANALARHWASDDKEHVRVMEALLVEIPSLATDLCRSLRDELVDGKAECKRARMAHFVSVVLICLFCLLINLYYM